MGGWRGLDRFSGSSRADGSKVLGRMEEGNFVTRFALHSGRRQGGGVFDAVCFPGLPAPTSEKPLVGDPVRPRLWWGGPLALGVVAG